MNSDWFGHASLRASLIRRTLMFTTASILSSFKRIVFAQARASAVPYRPMRRNECISTHAAELSHKRS